mgnify:CR=1 FL=1
MKERLCIYYSFEGNTEFVIDKLAEMVSADKEKLETEIQPPRKGLGKFLKGGEMALTRKDPGLRKLKADLNEYREIVIAYPVWAGTCPAAIMQFLREYPLKEKTVSIIACSASGNGTKSMEEVAAIINGCKIRGMLNLINPLKNQEKTVEKLREFTRGW